MSTITESTLELDVRQVGGRVGAEISGVDLSHELDDSTFDQVNKALLRHKALIFRGQHLDDTAQLRFASRFGPLTTAHPTVPSVEGQPHILPVDADEGIRANNWHTDVTFVLTPPKVSTLRAVVIPPYGGNTLIANAAAAYRDLPEPLRAFADTLTAVHTNDYDYAQPQFLTDKNREYQRLFTSTRYQTAHPVVRVHPETGEHGLFIGGFAQRIVGLSKPESTELLKILQQYVTRPENVLRVTWEPGQLVLFDNRITQHYAVDNYDDAPRRLNRVTVAGDIPVGIDGSPSYSVKGDASHYTPVAAIQAA
jgi:taurine dioxygenase